MFEQRLKPLNEAVHFTAPEGMALTSGEDMQLAAARNVVVNAGGDISVGTMGNLTALAGEKLGLFARTGQLSVKSGEGPIDIHAQNASLRLLAEKKLTLSSANDISLAGKKRITLIGGGSYLRLEAGKIEYGRAAVGLDDVAHSEVLHAFHPIGPDGDGRTDGLHLFHGLKHGTVDSRLLQRYSGAQAANARANNDCSHASLLLQGVKREEQFAYQAAEWRKARCMGWFCTAKVRKRGENAFL